MLEQILGGRMRICLETLQILSTTKNFETFKNRMPLLYEHLPFLSKYQDEPEYINCVSQAKQSYELNYPDRTVDDMQIAANLQASTISIKDNALKICCPMCFKIHKTNER